MFASYLQQESLSYHQTQYHCCFILTGNQIMRPWHLLFLVRGQHWFQKQESASKEKKITSRQRKNNGEQNCPTSKRGLNTKGRGFSGESRWVKASDTEISNLPEDGEHFIVKEKWKFAWISSTNTWTCSEKAVSCLACTHPQRRSERRPALLLFR